MKTSRDGVGLGYADAGHGDPPILLVHGWGTDRTVMKPLFDWARRSRRVVALDLRGFGESDAPEQPYTIEAYSDDLSFIVSRLGMQRPIVIGHSMGGLIALDFAARHAAEVAAAVVLEPMAIAPELLAGLRPILAGVRADGYRDVVAGLMGYLTGPHFDPGERARLVSFIRACRQHVLISAMEGILAFDSEAAARNVTCPLLYVGTNTTYANIARFRELCPQLVTGQLVGCGHYFPLEVPEQLTAMVARFIQTNMTSRQVPQPPTDVPPRAPE
jgi:pimeloyl-ACP methyl ester carboxylesterase